jgi:hypothetical protein
VNIFAVPSQPDFFVDELRDYVDIGDVCRQPLLGLPSCLHEELYSISRRLYAAKHGSPVARVQDGLTVSTPKYRPGSRVL